MRAQLWSLDQGGAGGAAVARAADQVILPQRKLLISGRAAVSDRDHGSGARPMANVLLRITEAVASST
jgi:hypothetical protein